MALYEYQRIDERENKYRLKFHLSPHASMYAISPWSDTSRPFVSSASVGLNPMVTSMSLSVINVTAMLHAMAINDAYVCTMKSFETDATASVYIYI